MRTMRLALTMSIAVVAAMTLTSRSVLADDKEMLIGTWKLVEAVSEDLSTHEKTEIYKGGALGFITYGSDGRMMAIVVNARRTKPGGNVATGAEAEALFRTMASYAGSYTIRGSQITHHVDASWNEAWTGTDQIRHFVLDGDTLTITTAPYKSYLDGTMGRSILVWSKVT